MVYITNEEFESVEAWDGGGDLEPEDDCFYETHEDYLFEIAKNNRKYYDWFKQQKGYKYWLVRVNRKWYIVDIDPFTGDFKREDIFESFSNWETALNVLHIQNQADAEKLAYHLACPLSNYYRSRFRSISSSDENPRPHI